MYEGVGGYVSLQKPALLIVKDFFGKRELKALFYMLLN